MRGIMASFAGLFCPLATARKVGLGALLALMTSSLGGCQITQLPPPPDVEAAPADATVTSSGLAYKVLTSGAGATPTPHNTVRVHYTGWTTDGKTFDSSISRGKPVEFPVTAVIPGWVEGLQLMQAGSEYRFWIPESLAYKGSPGKPAGTLVFDVQILEIR